MGKIPFFVHPMLTIDHLLFVITFHHHYLICPYKTHKWSSWPVSLETIICYCHLCLILSVWCLRVFVGGEVGLRDNGPSRAWQTRVMQDFGSCPLADPIKHINQTLHSYRMLGLYLLGSATGSKWARDQSECGLSVANLGNLRILGAPEVIVQSWKTDFGTVLVEKKRFNRKSKFWCP